MNKRFTRAIQLIDDANSADPRLHDGRPFELVHAEFLTTCIKALEPDASEALLLAARGQHICRWRIPRDTFPQGLKGYLAWREKLKAFHADQVAGLLREAGYGEDFIQRVQSLVRKEHFPEDRESCVLEDALCLAFIQLQLDEMLDRKPEAAMREIVLKTWVKMTTRGKGAALALPLTERVKSLLQQVANHKNTEQ